MRNLLVTALLLIPVFAKADTTNFWRISVNNELVFADNEAARYFEDSVIVFDLNQLQPIDTITLQYYYCAHLVMDVKTQYITFTDSTGRSPFTVEILRGMKSYMQIKVPAYFLSRLKPNVIYSMIYSVDRNPLRNTATITPENLHEPERFTFKPSVRIRVKK